MQLDMGFSEIKTNAGQLDQVLRNAGFVNDGAWDYYHVTYDYKYEDQATKTVYYLRIRGEVAEGGELDQDAILKLDEPHMGKHLFPHGIDYQAEVPAKIQEAAKKKLSDIKAKLS